MWDSRDGYFGESQKVELARWQALPELTGIRLSGYCFSNAIQK